MYVQYFDYLPMKSNVSSKYCLIFSLPVSSTGICLYFSPVRCCTGVGECLETFSTYFAPTFLGLMASLQLPSNRCGNTGDAGYVSISAIE